MKRFAPVRLQFIHAVVFSLLVFPVNAAKVGGTLKSEIPSWFKQSFLDLREDVKDAKQNKRRLMIYFHQDGCPYCAELVNKNFSQKATVDFINKHFDSVDINMWGDREVTHLDGKTYSEKDLAAALKVWFTPTLLFLDENGKIVLRINGYYPPNSLMSALQYVAGKNEHRQSFRAYIAKHAKPAARGSMHSAPYLLRPPYDFARLDKNKPTIVFFEQKQCPACDLMHDQILSDRPSLEQLKMFNVLQVDMWGKDKIVLYDSKETTTGDWAKKLGISYAPSAVLFDNDKEIIRIEAFLKGFHVQSVMDYVSSGEYKTEPSLQRFIQKRAEILIDKGNKVDLWK